MNDIVARERQYIEELRSQYRNDGFDELSTREVQKELGIGYEPDLAVKRGEKVIVFEVKNAVTPRDSDRLRRIKQTIESKAGWQFQFHILPIEKRNAQYEDAIAQANTSLSVSQGMSYSYPAIAAVTLWIPVETAMRQLLTAHGERPLYGTSGLSLARRLRDLGELNDDEYRLIAGLSEMRNRAAHGYELPSEQKLSNDLFVLAENLMSRAGALKKSPADEQLVRQLSSLKKGETVTIPASDIESKLRIAKSTAEPRLDSRHRDKAGEITRKAGNTLVRTLRKTYGADFAKGLSGDRKLRDVLDELDEPSLAKLIQRSRSRSS